MNFYYITAKDRDGNEATLVITGNVEIKSYPPTLGQEEHNFIVVGDKIEIGNNIKKPAEWKWMDGTQTH